MTEERLVIEIGEDGEVNVDLNGFKGKGCAAVMDVIEEALGPAKRTNKSEYDMKARTGRRVTERIKTGV